MRAKYLVFVSILLFSCTIFAKNGKKSGILGDLWPRVDSIAVRGDFIAATTDAGLRLFKCSNKSCRETDRFKTPDALSAAAFTDNSRLLTSGGMGLWSLNINPDNKLKLLWHHPDVGAVRELLVTPDLVVAAMGAMGIQIYKRQGGKLVPKRIYPTGDYCRGIALQGTTLYAACGYDGLLILDISDPVAPVRKVQKKFVSPVHNLLLHNGMLFLALGRLGVAIVSILDPSNPQVVGRAKLLDGARSIAVYGHFMYVADGMKGVGIFDITNPRHPVDKGHLNAKGAPVRLIVNKKRLIIANDYAGIAIYDLSIPDKPTELWRTKR